MNLIDFTGGEASIYPITKMPPKYALTMQNCYISDRGGVSKIPGYAKVNSATAGVNLTSGFEFKKSSGATELLVAGGGKIFKVSGGTLVEIKGSLDTNAKVSFTTMNDLCIMVNGVDAPMKYDGTTVSALGGTPPATTFKAHTHKNRVWMIERGNKMLASHSALNNPEDYTTAANAGYIDFKFILKKGDELLDIATFVDFLIFFFRSQIVIYSGSNPTASGDFKLIQVIDGAGVKTTDVVQGLGTDIAFLYDSGVKSLRQVTVTGNLNTNPLSEKIDPSLLTSMKTASQYASGHYPKLGWYLLLLGNVIWTYSYVRKAWSKIIGADCYGMFGTAGGDLYLCGTGFLYKYDEGYTFAGVSPAMIWELAWLPISKGFKNGSPKMLELLSYAGPGTVVDLNVSYDMHSSFYDTSLYLTDQGYVLIDSVSDWDALNPIDDPAPLAVSRRVPVFGRGRYVRLKFSNTSENGPIEITDITMQINIGNR